MFWKCLECDHFLRFYTYLLPRKKNTYRKRISISISCFICHKCHSWSPIKLRSTTVETVAQSIIPQFFCIHPSINNWTKSCHSTSCPLTHEQINYLHAFHIAMESRQSIFFLVLLYIQLFMIEINDKKNFIKIWFHNNFATFSKYCFIVFYLSRDISPSQDMFSPAPPSPPPPARAGKHRPIIYH